MPATPRFWLYDGNTLVGVVIVGLNEGAIVTVDTTNDFNRLVISNYDNVASRARRRRADASGRP